MAYLGNSGLAFLTRLLSRYCPRLRSQLQHRLRKDPPQTYKIVGSLQFLAGYWLEACLSYVLFVDHPVEHLTVQWLTSV